MIAPGEGFPLSSCPVLDFVKGCSFFLTLAQEFCQSAYGRILKELDDRQIDPKRFVDPGLQLRREQRMPPNSKKLSSVPTRSSCKTCSQMRAMVFSRSFCAGTNPVSVSARRGSGIGSALRSILPLGVSGRFSRNTKAEGTM